MTTAASNSVRHSFVTLRLDADADATLRDPQRAGAHADPRPTAKYNRRRKALDIRRGEVWLIEHPSRVSG